MKREEIISKSKEKHGLKYDYSSVVDTNGKDKITLICPIHGEFKQQLSNHLSGKGCKLCGGNNHHTLQSFIKKARTVHENKYDYSKVSYVNNKSKVKIICPEHGEFEQTPNSHLMGRTCNLCANNLRNTNKKLSLDNLLKKCGEKHNKKYDYSKIRISDINIKTTIICPIHGEFKQRLLNHLYQGNGCPKCKQSKGENEISMLLTKLNINFIQQHKFSDCRNIRPLPFDFYLPDYNTCIEYHGIQHYKPVKRFGGDIKYKTVVERDDIKAKYCKDKQIKLLIIKYDENIIKRLNDAVSGEALKTRMRNGDIPTK